MAQGLEHRHMHRSGRTDQAAEGQIMKGLCAAQGGHAVPSGENRVSSQNDVTTLLGSTHFCQKSLLSSTQNHLTVLLQVGKPNTHFSHYL